MVETNGNGRMAQLSGMETAELLEVINSYDLMVETLSESMADIQLAQEDIGWRRLNWDGQEDLFDASQIIEIIQLSRIAWIMNPLINHAAIVQANYVFGQGASVRAKPGPEVNEVLQTFWDNPQNKKVLTGPIALWNKEVTLRTESNIFFVLFTNISNGEVIVRTIPPEEFIKGGIIFNPEDRFEPWFYHRIWTTRDFNPVTGTFADNFNVQEAFYPDIDYNPGIKPDAIRTHGKTIPVHWESPIKHVKVGNIEGQPFGVPEMYSALNWARAVKLDLEDYATLRRALARFAWNLKTTGGKAAVQQAKLKLASTLQTGGADTNPPPATGSTFIGAEGRDMQPMKLAGSTPNPEEGRRLWLMVSAGTGIPETILSGNADVGNLATARTLDRPTELQMKTRQTLWEEVLKDICMYVIAKAVEAPSGPLRGDVVNGVVELTAVERAPSGRGRPRVVSGNKVEIEVNYPPILERNKKENVDAIVDAITLSGREPKRMFSTDWIRRELLNALQEADVDGAIDKLNRDAEEGIDFPGPSGPDTQQPGTGEAVQQASTRERVTNNEFVDQA